MKKLLWSSALLVIALVGAVVALPLALGSDMLRSALSRQLSDVAGAEVSLGGPIHFSVFPDFGIVVEDLNYSSGDGAVSVASSRSVASVNLMSLFSDQIRITGIELGSPRIVLGDAAPGESAATPAGPEQGDDIFRTASAYLERFSFDRVEVIDGQIARNRGGTLEPVASDIDLHLTVPGIGEPASLTLSGVVDGKRTQLAADIGSLRDLLARQPAEFSLSATTEHPPHPALADVRVLGHIQLADDGSYRVTGGEIDSAGEKLRLDVSYAPGDRPFVMARIGAGTLDYSDFQPARIGDSDDAASGAAGTPGGGLDLSALRDFDAEIELSVEAMRVGAAVAHGIVLEAELYNGRLATTFNSSQIAGGGLAADLQLDLNQSVPQAGGSLKLAAVDIESLMGLAGLQVPVAGRLSSDVQYAFLGTAPDMVAETINLRGTVSIAEGTALVPQLAQFAGPNAGRIEAIDARLEIQDISSPLGISGTARWNGESVGFASSLAVADLIAGQAGAATFDVRSQPVNANFSGTFALDGRLAGRADVSAGSLNRALAWFGQDMGSSLGRFSFSGGIATSASEVSLSDAAISLDDINATGSIAMGMGGKPKLTANLTVDALDFGKLTGGGSSGTSGTGPAAIDLAVLRQFDADIRLNARQIGYGAIKAGPATATLSVADGVARLAVPQAGFYDGVVTADIMADGSGQIPTIAIAAGMNGIDALPFLRDAAGFSHLEGRLTAEVDVRGSGGNTEAFARALNGKAGVVFSDGALRGIDVANVVRNIQSMLGGGYAQDAEAKTEFTELSVALDVQNGVAQTDNIRLLGPLVRMSGEGRIDLAGGTIDMRLDPRVVGSLDGQGGEFDVSGLGMPVIVTGALASPRIYPDFSGVLADPGRALEALSGLGGGMGELSGQATDAIGMVRDTLENDSGLIVDGLASGLIDHLGGGRVEESGTAGSPFDGGVLMETLFGGVIGQAPQAQPANVQEMPSAPQTVTEDAAIPEAQGGGAAGNIPAPRPDPRTGPIEAPAPPPQPSTPSAPLDQILNSMGMTTDSQQPQDQDQSQEQTGDMIRNLLEQIEW